LEAAVPRRPGRGGSVEAQKLTAIVTAKNTLAAEIDHDYCWMRSNKSASSTALATMMVKLQR
jgi:hypothetical protein